MPRASSSLQTSSLDACHTIVSATMKVEFRQGIHDISVAFLSDFFYIIQSLCALHVRLKMVGKNLSSNEDCSEVFSDTKK